MTPDKRTGWTKHGLARTPAYNSWKKMMARCYRASDPFFARYGGRGIAVCERWHDVAAFVEDMGQRAKGLSLERDDVDGNYEPSNCRWIPMSEQARNRAPWRHTPEGLRSISASRAGKKLSTQHKQRISAGILAAFRAVPMNERRS